MPTTTPVINDGLERLAVRLYRSLAANRYHESQECMEQLIELHTQETHAAILAVLDRARRVAMVQRSLASSRLEDLRRAAEYLRNSLAP